MTTKKTTHVVPNKDRGGWDIKQGGSNRSSGHFDKKNDAIDRARAISQNRNSELFIHKRDGKIGSKDSHGNDPYPPKG
ncbi:MAG: DUF2188 domain-containing protein [Halobacteriovoraceae bacterium]|nr:DUF2188 domain-containing protein [Halobacteriovoraceae bacterium]